MAHDRNRQAPRAQCPEQVLAWIPWYADGLLSERERGAVEAHAAVCADCRTELDIVSGAPWACEGVELPDAERIFDEISARIAADGDRSDGAAVIPISRGRVLSEDDMARLERWLLDPSSEREVEQAGDGLESAGIEPNVIASNGPSRRRSRFASPVWAAAAGVALLLLGGLAGGSFEALRVGWKGAEGGAGEGGAADYALASSGPATSGEADAPMLDVVFSDDASARAIWSTLRSLGVEIVAGPTNLGVYRLRVLPAGGTGGESERSDAAAIAAKLVEGEGRIAIFAEPVPCGTPGGPVRAAVDAC